MNLAKTRGVRESRMVPFSEFAEKKPKARKLWWIHCGLELPMMIIQIIGPLHRAPGTSIQRNNY